MNLSELLEQTRPPDSELVDLIEWAYLAGQIDGRKAELAYLWLRGKTPIWRELLPTVLHKAQRVTPRMM